MALFLSFCFVCLGRSRMSRGVHTPQRTAGSLFPLLPSNVGGKDKKKKKNSASSFSSSSSSRSHGDSLAFSEEQDTPLPSRVESSTTYQWLGISRFSRGRASQDKRLASFNSVYTSVHVELCMIAKLRYVDGEEGKTSRTFLGCVFFLSSIAVL